MGIISIGQLPNLDVFGIFTYHFIFAAWSLLECGTVIHKSGTSTLFFNSVLLLIVLMWCIKDSQSELPLILAIRINIVSLVFDVFLVIISSCGTFFGIFILFGRIGNMLLRFVTIPLLSKICSDKTGGINDGLPELLTPIFGVDHGNVARDPYENIDNMPHQSYPKSEPVIGPSGSYSFTGNAPVYQAQA